jgi:hypothetical protein
LYDCDFNQMLELPLNHGAPRHIRDFDAALIERRRIAEGQHCYGCTAGSGSSCGGSITSQDSSSGAGEYVLEQLRIRSRRTKGKGKVLPFME